jgi:hypothetical protein
MQTMYAHGIGHHPCHNVILIVDEVDDLIVDKNPNDVYGIPHVTKSANLKVCFDCILANITERPAGVTDSQLWSEVKAAYKLSKKKCLGIDYVLKQSDGEKILAQVINGKANLNSYALWLEILRYKTNASYCPVYRSFYFVQSMPHLINAYDCVVGLSGSLGSEAEAAFLASIYGAWSYIVPPFLNTCVLGTGQVVGKCTAKLLNDELEIHRNAKVCQTHLHNKYIFCVLLNYIFALTDSINGPLSLIWLS